MKLKLIGFILLFSFLFSSGAGANPFRQSIVCVPKINFNQSNFEFTVREGGPCSDEETWMQVYSKNGGEIHLLPIDPPLPAQNAQELEAYKKFYGIER